LNSDGLVLWREWTWQWGARVRRSRALWRVSLLGLPDVAPLAMLILEPCTL